MPRQPEHPLLPRRTTLAHRASILTLLAVAATLTMGARECESSGGEDGCVYEGNVSPSATPSPTPTAATAAPAKKTERSPALSSRAHP